MGSFFILSEASLGLQSVFYNILAKMQGKKDLDVFVTSKVRVVGIWSSLVMKVKVGDRLCIETKKGYQKPIIIWRFVTSQIAKR